MITKTFKKNSHGKIEFTEQELKELLDDIYRNGYQEGKGEPVYIYTSPNWWTLNKPFYTYTTTTANGRDYSTTSVTSNITDSVNFKFDTKATTKGEK